MGIVSSRNSSEPVSAKSAELDPKILVMNFEFALVSSGPDSLTSMLPQSEFDRPYEQRDRFTIEADPDDSLASLREKAYRHFGFEVPDETHQYGRAAYGPCPFFKEGDQTGFVERAMPRIHWSQLTLIDSEGRALFGVHDFRSVTVADLLRASEAGVVDGDVLRPYLVAEGGWGDQPPPDWPTLIHGFEVAWPYIKGLLEGLGLVVTAKEVWERIAERIRTGSESATKHREWSQRHFSPYQFQALLRTRNWSSEQIATLLDCSLDEVEPIMWCLGFEIDPGTETWSEQADQVSEFVRAIHQEIAIASTSDPRNDLDELLRKRLNTALLDVTHPASLRATAGV